MGTWACLHREAFRCLFDLAGEGTPPLLGQLDQGHEV